MQNGLHTLLALGRDAADVGLGAMVLRTIVIYACTLSVVRVSGSSLLSKATPFDYIVAILPVWFPREGDPRQTDP